MALKLSKNKVRRSSASARPIRSAKAKAPAKAQRNGGPGKRRPTTDDPRVIKRHVRILQDVGARRKEAKEEHDAAVEAAYEAIRDAMDDGVPTGVITANIDISRQWMYKMGEHRGAEREGKINGQPVGRAARTPVRKPQGRTTPAKTATRKRIKIRS